MYDDGGSNDEGDDGEQIEIEISVVGKSIYAGKDVV